MVPAAELVRRMSGRALPDASAPRVQREIDRIRDGKRLRPVLAVGDTIADGEHRLAAVHRVSPSASVAVVRIAGNQTKGEDQMSKSKIQKSTIQDAGARSFIAGFADELARRYGNDPACAGLASKCHALADGPALPDDGTGLASAMQDGAITSTYRTNTSKVEQALGRMTELRKRDDLTPEAQSRCPQGVARPADGIFARCVTWRGAELSRSIARRMHADMRLRPAVSAPLWLVTTQRSGRPRRSCRRPTPA